VGAIMFGVVGFIAGGLLGLIAGVFVGGLYLMIYRMVMHMRGKHD
jgi:hypothetical protein